LSRLLTRRLRVLALILVVISATARLLFVESVDSSIASTEDVGFAQTATGFFYPTGVDSWAKTGGTWLGRDADHDTDGAPSYTSGFYHLGVDIPVPRNHSVYAISNGTILYRSVNGWGDDNIALAIKHRLADGTEFLAIYGHIRTSLGVGERVSGGVKFAEVGPFPESIDHLHFAIHPALNVPQMWGRAGNSSWSQTFGHVNPVNWTTTQSPKCGDATSERFRQNGSITSHPNGTLIKVPDDGSDQSRIVYVLQNGRTRAIPSEQRLHELYGPGRGFDFRDVITVDQAEFQRYTTGDIVSDPLPNPSLPDGGPREPDGRLIRQRGSQEIAIVSDGKRRPFASWRAFLGLGYLPCNIATVDDYNRYPLGATVESTITTFGGGDELADLTAPSLTISTPNDGQSVTTSSISVSGTATDANRGNSGITSVVVNGSRAANDTATGNNTAHWSKTITLSPGANNITVAATDGSITANTRQRTITVFLDPPPTPTPTPTPKPTPSPSPTPQSPVIRGRISDANGNGIAGAHVNCVSGSGTHNAFTDSNGNFLIENVISGQTYNLTPSKQGFYFIPRSQRLETITTDRTANFTARPAPSPAPLILAEDDSDRAASLDSVTWERDPYTPSTSNPIVPDGIRRATILISNLELPAGEPLMNGDVVILAEDSDLQSHLVNIDYMGKIPGQNWLTQLNLKLPSASNIVGDLWLRVNFLGTLSNRVRITLALPELQFLMFVEGNPGTFGDNIVIDKTAGLVDSAFELKSPIRLGGLRNGLTFTVGVPIGSASVHSLSFNVVAEKQQESCKTSFGAGGGLTLEAAGFNFRYLNVSQGQLESFVIGANSLLPGCNFTLHDVSIRRLFLYSSNSVGPDIPLIDAAVVGLGQDKFPRPRRP
jgi:murein DD-endopeptidase MepM/ murein hydrolase activator NlpD